MLITIAAAIFISSNPLPTSDEECPSCGCMEAQKHFFFEEATEEVFRRDIVGQCYYANGALDEDGRQLFKKVQALAQHMQKYIKDEADCGEVCETYWDEAVAILRENEPKHCWYPELSKSNPDFRETLWRCDANAALQTETFHTFQKHGVNHAQSRLIGLIGLVHKLETSAFVDQQDYMNDLEQIGRAHPQFLDAIIYIAQKDKWHLAFQSRVYDGLELLFEKGLVSGEKMGRYLDNVTFNREKKQYLGTFMACRNGRAQLTAPIIDSESVNMLRAKYGYGPLSEDMAALDAKCQAGGIIGADGRLHVP